MSYRAKADALRAARAARSKIKNPKPWRIDVFENLGWHWHLELIGSGGERIINISPSSIDGTFFASNYCVSDWPRLPRSRNINTLINHLAAARRKFYRRALFAMVDFDHALARKEVIKPGR